MPLEVCGMTFKIRYCMMIPKITQYGLESAQLLFNRIYVTSVKMDNFVTGYSGGINGSRVEDSKRQNNAHIVCCLHVWCVEHRTFMCAVS